MPVQLGSIQICKYPNNNNNSIELKMSQMYIFTQKIQRVVIFKIKTVMKSMIRILTLDNGMTMLLNANITIITVHARDYRYAFFFLLDFNLS